MPQAFVFPGQGSQEPEMGRDLVQAFPAARSVFQEVDDALGRDLSRLMFEGPRDELMLTENAQPALLTVGMALVRVLEERFGTSLTEQAEFLAGHSLGEYTALTAARALSLHDAVRLVQARGRAIQDAAPSGMGGMTAIIGLSIDTMRVITMEAAGESEVCQLANDNAPDEQVVSGHVSAVRRAGKMARARGATRVVDLDVSAPFHSALVAPATAALERQLSTIEIDDPQIPVIANMTATPLDKADAIRRRLIEQVTGMVRWRETVEFLRDQGVDLLVELGPGTVLTELTPKIDPALRAQAVGGPRGLEQYLTELAAKAEA